MHSIAREKDTPMKLKILISCAIAALFIAGCSGGGGGGTMMQTSPSKSTQSVSVTLDKTAVNSSMAKRNAKFIASSVNDVGYAFSPGGPSADVALNSSNCTDNTCTITINAVPVGTYTLTLTLKDSGTAVGTFTEPNFQVALGSQNSVQAVISPILTGGLAGPSISFSPSPAVFYVDNEGVQTISASVNELDPVGDVICGSTKSVPNWPTLTVSVAGSPPPGLSVPSPTVSTPPACPGWSGNVAIDYNKSDYPNPSVTSAAISVTDGTTATSLPIPFVSLSTSQTSLDIVDASTPQQVTITETNGALAGETGFSVTGCNVSGVTIMTPQAAVRVVQNEASPSPTPSPADVTVSVPNGAFSNGTSDSTESFNVVGAITALDSACTLTFASNVHAALTTSVSLTIAPSVGVTISSKLRK